MRLSREESQQLKQEARKLLSLLDDRQSDYSLSWHTALEGCLKRLHELTGTVGEVMVWERVLEGIRKEKSR